MTEWNPAAYVRRPGLQEAMAQEALALLHLSGSERVLDIGCGDGRITAEIATRLPSGSILGVDSSHDMIAYAGGHDDRPNIAFQVADAGHLPFHNEFDLVVSFNALHWLPDPDPPLRCIHAALKSTGKAQLRLVPDGPRKSLETVIQETWKSPLWIDYFEGFRDPYLHVTPEQYAQVAERNGLRVESMHTSSHSWDFHTRADFFAFGSVTFVGWTRRLPDAEKPVFITQVLENYEKVAADTPGEAHTFKFYQFDVALSPSE